RQHPPAPTPDARVETAVGREGAVVTDAAFAPQSAADDEENAVPVTHADTLARVEALLRKEPYSFGFFQAVRLLRQMRPDRAAVGLFTDPADEVVRFGVPASIAFPPSEIAELDAPPDRAARIAVNFMGLTGPQGLLPYHYT